MTEKGKAIGTTSGGVPSWKCSRSGRRVDPSACRIQGRKQAVTNRRIPTRFDGTVETENWATMAERH